jgi:hypothetical protein
MAPYHHRTRRSTDNSGTLCEKDKTTAKLLTAPCSFLTAHCSLFTAHYSLIIRHRSLLTVA